MKLKFIIFFFFISLNLFAQPGDYGYSKTRFEELTKILKADPDNYQLIWDRIKLSRFNDTYFDIYKKSGNLDSELSYFKTPDDLFDGLNKLIDNNVFIDNHNIAEFKLLRGRLFYFSGKTNKALEDYLSALSYDTSFYTENLKSKIYISIAAYYYNSKEKLTEENARQALNYIDMANPNYCNSNQTPDCFEREKKELLKFLKEDQQLINYYKKLILAEYNSFEKTKRSRFVTTDYIYFKNQYYFRILNRVNDLAEFYNEIKNCKESRYLTEQAIKYLPPNNNGQAYKTFPREKLKGIEDQEYSKRFFNLHYEEQYKELTWDYQDISRLIGSLK